ncbi:MAG: hypothetical protein ACPIOQ_03040 [Promethearchaeia archaeon]
MASDRGAMNGAGHAVGVQPSAAAATHPCLHYRFALLCSPSAPTASPRAAQLNENACARAR